MTSRGTANVLTRATAILAGLFFATSLILSILAGMQPQADIDPRRQFDAGAKRARRAAAAQRAERGRLAQSIAAGRAFGAAGRSRGPERAAGAAVEVTQTSEGPG